MPPTAADPDADLDLAVAATRDASDEPRGGDVGLRVGDSVGRFRLVRLLGRGGMGVVFAARDPDLDREVALKLLVGPTRARSDHRLRFLREARAMAKLAHPNVITVYEVGEVDECPYIAMELVGGGTLASWLAEPRPWRAVRDLFVAAGRGLAAAHAAGLVHRDFKPSNVILDGERIRVADFGLAASLGDDVAIEPGATSGDDIRLTRTGAIVGTLAYLAPEVLEGQRATPAADQWSFFVALYEALYGRRPFAGDSFEALAAAIGLTPTFPVGPPRFLIAALRRGLARDPAARFPSMAAALRAIDRDPARTAVRGVAIAGGLGVVGTLAVLAGTRGAPPPTTPPRVAAVDAAPPISTLPIDDASIRRITYAEGCEELPAFARDGTLYFDGPEGEHYQRYAMKLDGSAPRALPRAADWELAPIENPLDNRLAFLAQGPESMSVYVSDGPDTATRKRLGFTGTRPTWSRDGRAVWGSDATALFRWDATTAAVTRKLPMPSGHIALRILELADGRVLALLHPLDDGHQADRLVSYRPDGGAPTDLFTGEMLEVMTLVPDESAILVALVTTTRAVDLWQVPLDGTPAARVVAGKIPARAGLTLHGDTMVWSDCQDRLSLARWRSDQPAERAIDVLSHAAWGDWAPVAIPHTREVAFVSDRTGTFSAYRTDPTRAGAPTKIELGDAEPVILAISPDGRTLATGTGEGGLFVAPLDGSAPARRIHPERGDLRPTFSRDGKTIYFERHAGADFRIAAIDVAGGEPRWVTDAPSLAPAVSPTADVLAYLTKHATKGFAQINLRDLHTGATRALAGAYHGQALAWSPDGTRLLVVSSSSGVTELEVATERTLRTLSPGSGQIAEATYVGDDVVIGYQAFVGDLWAAKLDPRWTSASRRPR